MSVLKRCLSCRDTTQWSKQRQGTTLGVRFRGARYLTKVTLTEIQSDVLVSSV